MYYATMSSPIGTIELLATDKGVCQLILPGEAQHSAPQGQATNHPVLCEAQRQLQAYFAGKLRSFTLSYDPQGTVFQHTVWRALDEIPYGTTISYAELAAQIQRPQAIRAVGGANGRNPLPIIRPCHRVIGSDASLTGFSAGLAIKRYLLKLECPTRW